MAQPSEQILKNHKHVLERKKSPVLLLTKWEALPCLIDSKAEPLSPALLSKGDGNGNIVLPHSVNVGINPGIPLLLGLTLRVDGAQGKSQTSGKNKECLHIRKDPDL